VANALTFPHAVAALVLCLAGAAKLRSPAAAAHAVALPRALIRAFAAFEIALGVAALLTASRAGSVLMALTYAGFAALTVALWRRQAPCGCFGEEQAPASPVQSLISAGLALICAASVAAGSHPLGWILERPPGFVAILGLGTAGMVYGTVVAYSELPLAWRSWSLS